jgi:hypothetical protein
MNTTTDNFKPGQPQPDANNHPTAVLELFVEELPTQHDLKTGGGGQTVGTWSTISTYTTSSIGTLASVACLG